MHERENRTGSGLKIAARLIVLVRSMLPIMLAAIAMGAIGFLCAIFITVFGGYALLHVLDMAAPFTIPFIFGAVAVFALLRGVLRYAEQACNHYIAFKLLALIRDKVFRALRRLAPAKLETKDKGNLVSVITTDIELLEVFYAHTISPVAIAVLVSGFMLVFLARYHLLLAVIALAGYLVVGIAVPWLVSRLGREAGAAYRRQSGALSSTVLDALRGLREVLQFGQGDTVLQSIETQTRRLGAKQKVMKQYEGLTTALTGACITLFSLLVLVAGGLLYGAGQLSFGGVLISFIALISSFGPVVALANLANNLLQTFAAAGRVLDILDEAPDTEDVVDGTDISFSGLTCEHVSFAYTGQEVLQDFSLTVPPGGIVGIAGKSGSGKSTLLRLIMRFWDVNAGSISLSGHNVRHINTKSLRQNQSFVTQETVLFHDTIENNVKVANFAATQEEVREACKKAAIHDFIEALPKGYATNVGELGDSLSGGERQRIGLARAFLHGAPLLLLDEPTSNLDSLSEGAILNALKAEGQGKTIVLVSHRLSTLGIADNVVHMQTERKS